MFIKRKSFSSHGLWYFLHRACFWRLWWVESYSMWSNNRRIYMWTYFPSRMSLAYMAGKVRGSINLNAQYFMSILLFKDGFGSIWSLWILAHLFLPVLTLKWFWMLVFVFCVRHNKEVEKSCCMILYQSRQMYS